MLAVAGLTLGELAARLDRFVQERDWDQFHTPRNLALSVMIEAAELGEHFQWTPAGAQLPTPEEKDAIGQEMADVLLYLLRLADKLQIDLLQAGAAKLELNALKYPVDKARGRSSKYDRL